ncbi:MAG: alpha/beta hydrolase [Chloroflexi bacterium]|nr:alpha/beta hydrolase [Chloroflexota bacterium]
MADNLEEKLQSIKTQVDGLTIHAYASPVPAPNQPVTVRPVFVLIHGLLISSRYMKPIAERLAEHYQVFVPDLPGFGQSDNPPHIFSLQELADAVVAWMDALQLPSANFLGNSLGCQVIVDLAVRYPARVEKLILTGPTVDPYARSMSYQLIRLLIDGPREHISLGFPLVIDFFAGGPYRAMQTGRYAIADPIQEKLTRVQAPTLIVRGECDPVVSQRWVEKATALLPNGQLCVVAGAPHAVTFSSADALMEIIRPFLGESINSPG